jgi:hypothetical protein
MIEVALAQLRLVASLALGQPFSQRALDRTSTACKPAATM